MVNVDFLLFTIMAKRQGGPQAHKYNRVGQTMNSNFPSVRQNVADAILSTTDNLTNASDNVRDRPIF